jgi:hypothetical protein
MHAWLISYTFFFLLVVFILHQRCIHNFLFYIFIHTVAGKYKLECCFFCVEALAVRYKKFLKLLFVWCAKAITLVMNQRWQKKKLETFFLFLFYYSPSMSDEMRDMSQPSIHLCRMLFFRIVYILYYFYAKLLANS